MLPHLVAVAVAAAAAASSSSSGLLRLGHKFVLSTRSALVIHCHLHLSLSTFLTLSISHSLLSPLSSVKAMSVALFYRLIKIRNT